MPPWTGWPTGPSSSAAPAAATAWRRVPTARQRRWPSSRPPRPPRPPWRHRPRGNGGRRMDPRDQRDPPAPWRHDGVTILCPVCRHPFVSQGRQRVGSAACRQAAWRRRQPTVPAVSPSLPARSPRPATVYECPSCGARLLGEQRCPDCRQFCRRIGPGGPCPHGDEPVALADLLPSPRKGGDPAPA